MCSQELPRRTMTTRMYYEQIGEHMKPGVHENFVDGFEIAEMSRYNTLKSENEQNRLKEYIDYKKKGQSDNYDITGETLIPECLNYIKNIMRSILTNSVGKNKELGDKTKPKDHTEITTSLFASVGYNTLQSEDEQNRLKEYIYYKKEGQCDNYDITGETLIPECLNYIKNIMRSILTNSVGKNNVLDDKTKPKDHTEARMNGKYEL